MSEMTAGDVEARVLRVTREVLAIEGDGPPLESAIGEDLGADSLDQLSLFMALEDEFGGRISEEEAEGLVTLRDVVNYVRVRFEASASE